MKTLRRLAILPLAIASLSAAPGPNFKDVLGLQLWSLRDQTKESTTGALDLTKSYGFKAVETAGTGSLSPSQFALELKSRGLTAVAAHIGYDAAKKDIAAAIRDVKALGAKYLIIPSLPHPSGFGANEARKYAADFNTFGAACKAEGIRFGYHPHGFEFTPTGAARGELAFDVLARETDPELVCFEMDIFWVFHAGQDPARLFEKFPGRWALAHVKDIRKGAVTGLSTGSAPPIDNVAVGTGQLNWPEILTAAQAAGVQHYFIEDETPTPLQCIPDSLKYLRGLKL
jgi:sugar phosphate isomerase/epimerase